MKEDKVNKVKVFDLEKDIKKQKLIEKAKETLNSLEIPQAKKIKKDLIMEFPNDVSELPRGELGRYLGIYESEVAYIETSIAQREIDKEYAETILTYLYNSLLVSENGSPTERKAKVLGSKKYTKAVIARNKVIAELKLLKASSLSYQNYARAISREISNRPEIPYGNNIYDDKEISPTNKSKKRKK